MSRFNQLHTNRTKTVNLAGGESYQESPKLAFVSLLLTSMVKDQYYRSKEKGLQEVVDLINQISDKKFVAKAAVYARTKFGMRSISHVVAGELAQRVKGEEWLKSFYNKIVLRPDDIMEIMAYYKQASGKKQSHAMRKGFARALARFDAYQLAKYNRNDVDVSLVDLANLVHPHHTEAVAQLVKGELKASSANTWESGLIAAGRKAENEEQKEELKADVWKNLILEKKIPYFALLRNLRNILEQAPELVPHACELLMDEQMIRKSLVLPFRFLTALDEIQKLNGRGTREIMGALNGALDKSTANVPKFPGETLVVLDESSSMSGEPQKIGSLFAAIMLKSNYADFMMFSNDARYVGINPADSTLTIAQVIRNQYRGGGTNFHAIFQEANKAYDRVIILSDEQGWVGYHAPTQSFAEYKTRVGTNPRIYSIDLTGYGTLQFPEDQVYALAGFSEKIFDVMKLLEQDRNALIDEIEKIAL